METTLHTYGSSNRLISDGGLEVTLHRYDDAGAWMLIIEHEGSKVCIADWEMGKQIIKIADAIMTAVAESESQHEAETFTTVSLA